MKKLIFVIVFVALAAGVGYYIWTDLKESKMDSNISEIPDLDRQIPEGVSAEIVERIEQVSQSLKENPDLFAHWLELGIYRKSAGDYEGAKLAWEYAAKIRPEESTALNNLADLHIYFLKDNSKGEQYLLKAIEVNLNNAYPYYAAYEFYADILNDNEKARAILEKGIAANPASSRGLQKLLDNL